MKKNEKLWHIALAVVCLIYILLRLWRLTDSCLWFDEIFSVHAAGLPFADLFWFVAQDLIHPPLFYLVLKCWIFAGGESLFWLRLFPFFFSFVALVPFILLGRELKLNHSAITLSLLFLAVNGALIKYAQEVRMYSIFLCLSLFSLWLFVRYFNLGKNIWILTLVNILLIYTHYFGWLLIFSEILAIVFFQRIKIRQPLIMLGILLLSFSPWIFTVWKATQTGANFAQNIGWIPRPNVETISAFGFDLIEPFYFQQSSVDPTSIFPVTVPILIIWLTALGFYLSEWKKLDENEKQNFRLLLIFIACPVLMALAASWLLPYSIWGTRHLLIVFAPTAILAAIVLTKINISVLKISLLTLLICCFFAAFLIQVGRPQPVYIWCAWENLAQSLDRTQKTKIYVFEDLVAYSFWFALRDSLANVEIIKVNSKEIPEDKAYFLPRGFDGVKATEENSIEGERFYVAFRDEELKENHPPLKSLIEKGYRVGSPKVFQATGIKGFLVEIYK
jgi:uncharacterized membrane protein